MHMMRSAGSNACCQAGPPVEHEQDAQVREVEAVRGLRQMQGQQLPQLQPVPPCGLCPLREFVLDHTAQVGVLRAHALTSQDDCSNKSLPSVRKVRSFLQAAWT